MGVLLRLDSFCLYTPELSTFNESFNEIMRHRARHIQSPSYISLDEHWNHSHLIESVFPENRWSSSLFPSVCASAKGQDISGMPNTCFQMKSLTRVQFFNPWICLLLKTKSLDKSDMRCRWSSSLPLCLLLIWTHLERGSLCTHWDKPQAGQNIEMTSVVTVKKLLSCISMVWSQYHLTVTPLSFHRSTGSQIRTRPPHPALSDAT